MNTATSSSRPLFGAAMVVLGMTLIGFIDNFVQVYAEHAGLWQFHLLRSLIAIPAISSSRGWLGFAYGRPTGAAHC